MESFGGVSGIDGGHKGVEGCCCVGAYGSMKYWCCAWCGYGHRCTPEFTKGMGIPLLRFINSFYYSYLSILVFVPRAETFDALDGAGLYTVGVVSFYTWPAAYHDFTADFQFGEVRHDSPYQIRVLYKFSYSI
jgi:hypothetical protein